MTVHSFIKLGAIAHLNVSFTFLELVFISVLLLLMGVAYIVIHRKDKQLAFKEPEGIEIIENNSPVGENDSTSTSVADTPVVERSTVAALSSESVLAK